MLLLNSSSMSVGGFEHRPFKIVAGEKYAFPNVWTTNHHDSIHLLRLQANEEKKQKRLAWREPNQRCHREASANKQRRLWTSTGCNLLLLATGLQLCANGAVSMEFGPLPSNQQASFCP